jgi:hemoglobin
MKEKLATTALGKKKAIAAVWTSSFPRAAADSRINKFFGATAGDPARLKTFKGNLVDQILRGERWPLHKGKDMKTAHMGMGVSGADFTALVEDLSGALDKFMVGAHEKDQLLGALPR